MIVISEPLKDRAFFPNVLTIFMVASTPYAFNSALYILRAIQVPYAVIETGKAAHVYVGQPEYAQLISRSLKDDGMRVANVEYAYFPNTYVSCEVPCVYRSRERVGARVEVAR